MGILDHDAGDRTEIFVGGEVLGEPDGDPPCICSPLHAGGDGVVAVAVVTGGMLILDAGDEAGDG